jgi:hypothetical protein
LELHVWFSAALVDLDVFPAFSDAKFCEVKDVIAICAAGG